MTLRELEKYIGKDKKIYFCITEEDLDEEIEGFLESLEPDEREKVRKIIEENKDEIERRVEKALETLNEHVWSFLNEMIYEVVEEKK